jgi:hypothetical protein
MAAVMQEWRSERVEAQSRAVKAGVEFMLGVEDEGGL